jgi:hypothetical protein
MFLRPRKIKLVVKLAGFKMPIAEGKIVKFADILEPKTELLCPKCHAKPKWQGRYECECGATYTHWSQLKRVLPNGKEIVKPKLIQGEDVEAEVYVMDKAEFSKYCDATYMEYGLTVDDANSALNLKKLIIALDRLNKVIILHFLDTYEERVCCLTLSLSNRIILKELIPLNLADIRETLKVDLSNVTDKDIAEAEALIKQLPKATEDLLYVHDYRIQGLEEVPRVSPKVIELEQILSKMKKENAII